MADDLRQAYHTIMDDHFPDRMEISFVFGEQRSTLVYEKVVWVIDGVRKGHSRWDPHYGMDMVGKY